MTNNDKQQESNFEKKPLFETLNLIGAIVLTISSFMGLNYVLKGSYFVAAPVVLILVLLPALILPKFLQKQKSIKPKRLQKEGMQQQEVVMLALYAIPALIAFFFSFHYLNIDFSQKEKIQQAGIDKNKIGRAMKAEYDKAVENKITVFENEVNGNLNLLFTAGDAERPQIIDKLNKQLGEGVLDIESRVRELDKEDVRTDIRARAETAMRNETERIRNSFKISELIWTDYKDFEAKAEAVFNEWDRFNVSFYFYEIDAQRNIVLTEMKSKNKEFSYNTASVTASEINFENPFATIGSALSVLILTFVLNAFFQALVLSPYFTQERIKSAIIIKKGSERSSGDLRNLQN